MLPLIAGLLAGCAGTPWGETLSGSFPPPREPESAPVAPTVRPPQPAPTPPAIKPPSAPAAPKAPQATGRQPAPTPKPKARPAANPSAPTPYRVTLRLPEADPSAPAEAVTQALRAAGIPFEVETIEKMKPAVPTTPEPAVRPAPPPR